MLLVTGTITFAQDTGKAKSSRRLISLRAGVSCAPGKAHMKLCCLITVPAAVGMSALAGPISRLLYGTGEAAAAIMHSGPATWFLGLQQVTTGMLQGMGHTNLPMLNMLIGIAAKLRLLPKQAMHRQAAYALLRPQLQNCAQVILRTAVHPTVAELEKQNVKFTSCDDLYEKAASFEEVYNSVVERVLAAAQTGKAYTEVIQRDNIQKRCHAKVYICCPRCTGDAIFRIRQLADSYQLRYYANEHIHHRQISMSHSLQYTCCHLLQA